jgi:primosomal protein N'
MSKDSKEEKKEEEPEDNPFGLAKVEKQYLQFVKSKGLSTNQILRMFYEGKLTPVEEVEKMKEKEKKEGDKEEKPSKTTEKVSSKIAEKIEEKGAEQIEQAMNTAMENFKKRMEELEEKAKRADELEKKMLEKEMAELKEKIKYLEEHKKEIKEEAIKGIEQAKELYKKRSDDEYVKQLEQKIDFLLNEVTDMKKKSAVERYKEELQQMAELKKNLDETFKTLFPDYEKKQEKTDWDGMMKLFATVSPMINNSIQAVLGSWMGMKQVDLLLAKAEKTSNPAIAERYLRQADMLMEALMRRQVGNPAMVNLQGSPSTVNAQGIQSAGVGIEDSFVNLLSQTSKEDIESFREGKLSLIPMVEEYLPVIKSNLQSNSMLLEQIKALSVEQIVNKFKQVRKDIQVDDKLIERIKSEFTAIKQMIVDEVEGGGKIEF